jgi:branched-chain amino acid aminotransferase
VGWVWQNGRLLPDHAARIDPSDRGLLLGDGLFETMRAHTGAVPLLPRHLVRLSASAVRLGIPIRYDGARLDAAIRGLLHEEELTDAAVRITLTRGPGPRGLAMPEAPAPLLMIRAFPRATTMPAPARAMTASIPRNERSPLSGMKTLGCLDQVLCLREAHEAGCDDAIMLTTDGLVACATAGNLFVVKDGMVATPDLGCGILPGITRAILLDHWPHIHERRLLRADLLAADEAFLTNSLIGVRPLVEIDGQPIGQGTPGPVTRQAADLVA